MLGWFAPSLHYWGVHTRKLKHAINKLKQVNRYFLGYFVFPVPGRRPQFVFDSPGPKFVLHDPDPQFVFTGPGPQFAFACSSFYN